MREIKARAWCHVDNMMYHDVHEGMKFDDGSEYTFSDFIESKGYHEFDVEQYTGLKDRNGKEIYIDDIVVLDLISGDRVSEVRICDIREIPVVKFFDEGGPFDGWEPLYCYVGKPDTCLVVCGNIHENPELVESCVR